MYTKRLATEAEASQALVSHANRWDLQNPNFPTDWNAKQAEALAQGYKNEVCSCGAVYFAFHHFTMCRAEGCPFNCGKSVLEMLSEG